MQTTVEQLLNTLKCRLDVINKETTELREQMLQDLLVDTEKYLEMEKQQHGKTWDSAIEQGEKRAWNISRLYTDFDDYFIETYGSKGSDETLKENHIVDTNEMVSSQTERMYTKEELEWQDKVMDAILTKLNQFINVKEVPNVASPFLEGYEQINQDNPITRGSTALVRVTSSQTEISDEEIEKRVKEVGAMGEYYKMGYRDAIKWYREQLKKKQ